MIYPGFHAGNAVVSIAGTIRSIPREPCRIDDDLELTVSTLSRIYGVVMQVADFSASASDGNIFDGPVP